MILGVYISRTCFPDAFILLPSYFPRDEIKMRFVCNHRMTEAGYSQRYQAYNNDQTNNNVLINFRGDIIISLV